MTKQDVQLSVSTNGLAIDDSAPSSDISAPPNTPVSAIFELSDSPYDSDKFDLSGKLGTMTPPTSVYDVTNQFEGNLSDSSLEDGPNSLQEIMLSLSYLRGDNVDSEDSFLDDYDYAENTSSSIEEPSHLIQETVFTHPTHVVTRTVLRPNQFVPSSCPESPVSASPARPSTPIEGSMSDMSASDDFINRLVYKLSFEEDVEYREYQWLLEQFGKTEVYVSTEVKLEGVDFKAKGADIKGKGIDFACSSRPRVFTLPPRA